MMRLRVKGKMDLKGLERALHSVPLRLKLDKEGRTSEKG